MENCGIRGYDQKTKKKENNLNWNVIKKTVTKKEKNTASKEHSWTVWRSMKSVRWMSGVCDLRNKIVLRLKWNNEGVMDGKSCDDETDEVRWS